MRYNSKMYDYMCLSNFSLYLKQDLFKLFILLKRE